MKMLGLLLALLVVGWLLYGQLGLMVPSPQTVGYDQNGTPQVPLTPQQLEAFDNDINQFVTESAAGRARQIEQNQ
ncbi:MAG: hypothetical protein RQ732_10340 [Methylophaga sp.]|nr:hypothetical protein [Methylophaga sp.]